MKTEKALDFEVIGKKELSLAEKANVLASRYRAQGIHLYEVVGVSAVTLSKVINLQVAATRKVRDAMIEAGHGFIVEGDFAQGPQPKKSPKRPEPKAPEAKAKKPEPKKPEPKKAPKAPVVEDDLDI